MLRAAVAFGFWLGAAQAVPDGSPVRLPNWQMDSDIWAVPRRAYDGFVSIQHVELPTDELAYQVAAPGGTETRTYFPALSYSDPVDGALLRKRSAGCTS